MLTSRGNLIRLMARMVERIKDVCELRHHCLRTHHLHFSPISYKLGSHGPLLGASVLEWLRTWGELYVYSLIGEALEYTDEWIDGRGALGSLWRDEDLPHPSLRCSVTQNLPSSPPLGFGKALLCMCGCILGHC